ncbi:MAG: hypothetical protein IID45_05225 [Planctomycetes bacterium]|nr:hypothetical protein [Planctomycetota bacterium]
MRALFYGDDFPALCSRCTRDADVMHGSTVIRVFAVLLGFCALGLYLVLTRTDQTVARRIRRIGAVTAAIAFCLFLFMAGTRPDGWPQKTLGWWTDSNSHWWPESQLQDIPTAIAFWVFAAGGVAAASFAVCTSRSQQAAIGLGLLSLFNAGLFVFHGAVLAAVATVVVTGGAAAALWWMETRDGIEESTETATDDVAGTPTTCDPAMACIVGFLISLMLVGTVSFALTE